ncbi:MAG: DPP IV N-terminal domain-containing protein [Bacteroidota bacterium]|nr:DPP IV N-terminal domain-containing protein [Bacteroidota bacterium]
MTRFLVRTQIMVVLMLFTLSLTAQTEKKSITLDDIYKNRKFSTRSVYGFQSMKDGDHYCQLKKDSINTYEYSTGKYTSTLVTSKNLIPAGDTTPIEMGSFEFSSDESRILFATNEEAIYRRSSKADYYVYDRKTNMLIPLSKNGKQRLATFSPDGTKVAFVRDNNLFIRFLDPSVQGADQERQITFDGKQNEIINGATDWVYEEEFEFSKAFFWSPDSKNIAFYRFNESRVKEYQLTYYGDLYPEQYKYKYPKAGEDNSLVTVLIFNLESGKTLPVDIGTETDIYIPRIKWTNDPSVLALFRMNRLQNKLELLLADAATGNTHAIYTETNKYYVEINDFWHFMKDNKRFLLTSEKDGYRHIYLYGMDGKLIRQLTTGNWEVEDVLGVDEKNGLVYFTSAEISPMDRNLYSVSLDGKKKKRITLREGTNVPEFNSTFTCFINRWSDVNTPPVITVNKANGEELRVLQDNARLRTTMQEYNFAKAEFLKIRTSDNVELNAVMLKPADFDPAKKYPVMFEIYGGPGYQTVINSWGAINSWHQMWAQHGIIVVSVDNRGSGGRGEEFKKMTYLQLGKYETNDQIEAAKYFASLPYVDAKRIGMWGWSFGGYLTLSCLTKGADYFSLGVAVAPVTNWKYYDNIYTERYMRKPSENKDGYEDNSPVNHAGLLKGKLLIICGTADDNVHPQNTFDMVTALVAANKQFEMQLYPNSNHGIYTGKNTTYHLYERMTEFILNNFAK